MNKMEDMTFDAPEIYPGCFSDEIRLSLSFYDKMRAKTPIELLAKTLNAKLGGDNQHHISARREGAKVYVLNIPKAMYDEAQINDILTRLFWTAGTKKDCDKYVEMQVEMDLLIDNKVPLVYLSGWMGAGKESGTYRWLARHFKNIDAYATGGQTDVQQMIRDVEETCYESYSKSDVSPIIIGNSYGGFIASQLGGTQVLLNPALFPSVTLPQIAELSTEEIENFRKYEKEYSSPRGNVYAICTEADELIPDHRTETVSTNAPVMIPGGAHRLTDEQRDRYLLPILAELVRPTFHIVKLSCDSLERLMNGECFEHASRRFPTAFTSKQDAEKYLQWHIKRNRAKDVKPIIGYMIQEIYGDNLYKIYRQWSYTPEGQPLAEAYINDAVIFDGREPQTLPFRKGDYVIAYCYGDLILGLIFGETCTPAEVEKMKQRVQTKARDGEVSYLRLDSSDDSYVVDFIDEYHGHPSVAQVFPLPFDVSEIPDKVKTALHWADSYKSNQ